MHGLGKWLKPFSFGLRFKINMELKGRITVYSIAGCPSCMRAKNALQEKGLPYTDVNIDTFSELREYVKERTGKATVPQIFFNNVHIGGSEALLEKLNNDYEKLVDDVKNNEIPEDAPKLPDPSSPGWSAKGIDFKCEPDQYAEILADFKQSGLIKTNTQSLIFSYKNSFTGQEFVNWVVKAKGLERTAAFDLGNLLVSKLFCRAINGSEGFRANDELYRLLEDEESNALNGGELSQCQPRKATEVAEDMRRLILKLYAAFLSPDGRKVDYGAIGKSQEYETYVTLTKELVRADVETLTREEKLAFFINIYNALVIHGIVERGPAKNTWQRFKFFNTVKYIMGSQQYSLQDIENGVLRGNRKGVGMLFRPFGGKDPRVKVALEKAEPLIHFTLVCGAKSCPPIKTFSPDGIMNQLNVAAEAFLEGDDAISVDASNKKVTISQIFKWYSVDFGQNNQEVLQFIHSHMGDSDKKTQLGELLKTKKYSLGYHPYDWSVNSK